LNNGSSEIQGFVKEINDPKSCLLQLNSEDDIALLQQWIATGKAIVKKVGSFCHLLSLQLSCLVLGESSLISSLSVFSRDSFKTGV
jgi:hypothetical protein